MNLLGVQMPPPLFVVVMPPHNALIDFTIKNLTNRGEIGGR